MRLLILVLFQFGLWTLYAAAFLPWCPEYGCGKSTVNSVEHRASTKPTPRSGANGYGRALAESAHLLRKFARLKTKSNVEENFIWGNNGYYIDDAAPTTQLHSVVMDQDGTDFSYFAPVRLGTNQNEYYMLVDTGSDLTWVMGSNCPDDACATHNTFGPANSSSLRSIGSPFRTAYGTGTVSGTMFSDTISIAGFNLRIEIGLADSITTDFFRFPFDGLLALGRGGSAASRFILELSQSGQLQPPYSSIFCFYFSRAVDRPNVGELDFGAVNPAKFTGPITYSNLTDPKGEWIIPMDSILLDGQAIAGATTAFLDTGTTYIYAALDKARAFHAAIPGAVTPNNYYWTVPCDTNASLTLVFSGVSHVIPSDDWILPPSEPDQICISNIYAVDIVPGSWLLGFTFLKNVYSVFDTDNARIGLAQKVVRSTMSAASTSILSSRTTSQISSQEVSQSPTQTHSHNPPQSPSQTHSQTLAQPTAQSSAQDPAQTPVQTAFQVSAQTSSQSSSRIFSQTATGNDPAQNQASTSASRSSPSTTAPTLGPDTVAATSATSSTTSTTSSTQPQPTASSSNSVPHYGRLVSLIFCASILFTVVGVSSA